MHLPAFGETDQRYGKTFPDARVQFGMWMIMLYEYPSPYYLDGHKGEQSFILRSERFDNGKDDDPNHQHRRHFVEYSIEFRAALILIGTEFPHASYEESMQA